MFKKPLGVFYGNLSYSQVIYIFFNFVELCRYTRTQSYDFRISSFNASVPSSRLERFLRHRKIIFSIKTRLAVNFCDAGVVTQSRRIGSWKIRQPRFRDEAFSAWAESVDTPRRNVTQSENWPRIGPKLGKVQQNISEVSFSLIPVFIICICMCTLFV
jgi:hypothetical protein